MKHAHNYKDVTGQKYGYLTAIKPVGVYETFNKKQNRGIKRTIWLFRCECGKEIERPRATFEGYRKKGITISCGCKSFQSSGKEHGHWTGFGEIPGTYFGQIKKGAHKSGHRLRNIEFNVTIEYLWELFLKQNRRCAYSGEILHFGTHRRRIKSDSDKTTASLDRINSDKGYVVGNVQWVHKDLNKMKQDFSHEVFIGWCKKIAVYRA